MGIVQGLTEFLPVSSTGHLVLAGKFLRIADSDFLKTFDIAIQSGTMFAVILVTWKRFLTDRAILKKVLAAFIPTGIVGFLLYKLIKSCLLGKPLVVVGALLVGGLLLIVIEKRARKKSSGKDLNTLSYRDAFLIGLFQSLSVVPGTSRSAATIIGGLCLGLSRTAIVEFSFLLAVPTLLAATGYDLLKSAGSFDTQELHLLAIGTLASFAVGLLVIRSFLRFIQKHDFVPFGIYRVLAAFCFWAILCRA